MVNSKKIMLEQERRGLLPRKDIRKHFPMFFLAKTFKKTKVNLFVNLNDGCEQFVVGYSEVSRFVVSYSR